MTLPQNANRNNSDPHRWDRWPPPRALSPDRFSRNREVQALCRRILNAETVLRRLLSLLLDAIDDTVSEAKAEPILDLLAATDTLQWLNIEAGELRWLLIGLGGQEPPARRGGRR